MVTVEIPSPKNPKRFSFRSVLSTRLSLGDLYAYLLILFLFLTFLPWRPAFVEVLVNLLDWFLIPAIPVFLFMLARRRWKRAALWGVPTLAFVILFGGLFLPGPPQGHQYDPAMSLRLKVMTWNLCGSFGTNRQPQIDLIRNSGADIIALQEINPDTETLINSQLADIYPFRITVPKGIAGIGLLSKYPIVSQDVFHLAPGLFYSIRATLDIDGSVVTVFSMHPEPLFMFAQPVFTFQGSPQINAVIKMVPHDSPVLMMGDFNMTDQMKDYRLLSGTGLRDTFREVGWGFGASWRIDCIWHSGEFHPLSAHVGSRTISDHLPIIAEFDFVKE
jgi:endonuclease/exonuclease/phosphatase (EEP) superfamily protein YafD